ncbi:MAG: nitroreductase [Dehalococcoidia bacterium]
MTSKADNDTRLSKDNVAIPGTDTTVYQALYRRRMAWQFKDEPVSREALERMLATAVWAPNHRLTEPWRFRVVEKGGPVRQKIGDLAYEYDLERNNNERRAQARRQKVLDPPIVVYVYTVPGKNKSETKENYASVACAVQNIALAGVAEGLAVTWETGGATRHPKLKETLEAEEDWDSAGMLLIGVPDEKIDSRRTPVASYVQWFD